MKKFYIIQEQVGHNTWFDIYEEELYLCKKMILIFKNKYPYKSYRLVGVYR